MTSPAIPGALNVSPPLTGDEIVGLGVTGPRGAQTTTQAIAELAVNAVQLFPLTSARNADGTGLAAAASSGKLGISNTLGTSIKLLSEAANSSTVTDTVMFEFILPATWDATSAMILKVGANYNLGSGTLGTNTLTAHGWVMGVRGTVAGTDLFASAPSLSLPATSPGAASLLTFTGIAVPSITMPGNRLIVSLVLVLQDTGGSNITGQINTVRFTQ